MQMILRDLFFYFYMVSLFLFWMSKKNDSTELSNKQQEREREDAIFFSTH